MLFSISLIKDIQNYTLYVTLYNFIFIFLYIDTLKFMFFMIDMYLYIYHYVIHDLSHV